MKNRGVVLYVDDCESVSWLVKRFFEKRYPSFELVTASSAEEAWDELEARQGGAEFPDAVITDIHLSGKTDGFALVEKVRAEFPTIRSIIVSGALSHEERDRSHSAGAHAAVEKTLSIDHFISLLFDLVQQSPAEVIPVRFRAA